MPEKFRSIEDQPEFQGKTNVKFVGKISEEERERAEKEFNGLLLRHTESFPEDLRESIKKSEYEKTEDQIALINFANKEVNKLMEDFGIKGYSFPAENIHFLPADLYIEISDDNTIALAVDALQTILINAEKIKENPPHLGAIILHESLHIKGYLAFELKEVEDEEGKYVNRSQIRTGTRVYSPEEKEFMGEYHKHFTGLNEAIVCLQTAISFEKMMDLPQLKKEKKWLGSKPAKELKKIMSEKELVDVWVSKEGKDCVINPYQRQREVLNYVVEEIQKDNRENYKSVEDVFLEHWAICQKQPRAQY